MTRSLVIVQVPPYPPMGGVALRNWQTLNLLKRLGEVAIFSIYQGPEQAADQLSQQGFTTVHYDIASLRRPLLEKVKNRLSYVRPDGYRVSDWLYTAEAARELTQLIQTFQPTLVVFEELWLYPYVKTVQRTTNARIVLDNHNIEGDKEGYRLASRKLSQIRYIEKRFVQQASQTWVCSDSDSQMLQQLYGVDGYSLKVIPNGVDAVFYQQPMTRERCQLLFLGKFSYQPNADAALILINEIYPQIKQRYPDTQLWLVGCDPTPEMEAVTDENIHITGMVPDVRPYLNRASTMVVPLYKGGGTRLKILEAFASYCPVVSTDKGAEGLAGEDTVHLCIGNTPEEMVEKVIYLWENESMAQDMAKKAHELFVETYSWQAVEGPMRAAVGELRGC